MMKNVLCSLSLVLIVSGCANMPKMPWTKSPDPNAVSATAAKPGDPPVPKNPFALARLIERRGQFDKAEQLYQDILKKNPNDPAPYHRLAIMAAQRGKFEDADKNFTKALAIKSNDPELLNDAGYFYYLASRPQDAERILRQAVALEPNNSQYCNNLALVLGAQRHDEECLALFRRTSPGTQANVNYAFVLAQRGEYKRALDVYDHALTEDRSLKVAADAMIELSRYTDKPTAPATSSTTTLATITEGRPVASIRPATPVAQNPVAQNPVMPVDYMAPPPNNMPPNNAPANNYSPAMMAQPTWPMYR